MPEQTDELTDVMTELEPRYRSNEERQIGRLLDQYGIVFFYRQPTVVYQNGHNETLKPAFTLPQYGGMVIDYVAERDDARDIEALVQSYRYNQIPATVLGPRDLDKQDWKDDLYERIHQNAGQAETYYGPSGRRDRYTIPGPTR